MKINVLIIFFSSLIFSCNSQNISNKDVYERENFEARFMSSRENDFFCKVYKSVLDSTVIMIESYTDSIYTRLLATHFKKNGLYTGPCSYFNEDGSVSMKGYYKEDEKDGKWLNYFADKSYSINYYSKGKKIGLWQDFDKNGKLIKEHKYD